MKEGLSWIWGKIECAPATSARLFRTNELENDYAENNHEQLAAEPTGSAPKRGGNVHAKR